MGNNKIKITNRILRGKVDAIPSKYVGQRAIILSCFTEVEKCVRLKGRINSEDMTATIDCLRKLGAKIDDLPDGYLVFPIMQYNKNVVLDCKESGATLRYLLPIVAALGIECTFDGGERLKKRPIKELIKCLKEGGTYFSSEELPISVSGKLKPKSYTIRGNITSQFVSGMLMALPLVEGKSKLKVINSLEARNNIDLTLDVISDFGYNISNKDNIYNIDGKGRFISPLDFTINGDWASTGTWLVAGALCGRIEVAGLDIQDGQLDNKIIDILDDMGARIGFEGKYVTATLSNLNAIEYDAKETPDIVPILSTACAVASGTSKIYNVERLKSKEGNRLEGILELLNNVGINAKYEDKTLVIEGGMVIGGEVNTRGDHRLMMMALLLGCVARDDLIITGIHSVDKIYPDLLKDYVYLGGKYTFVD